MPDDRLPSALEEIRERGYENGAHGAHAARLSDAAAVDVPRLLAVVDKVLALADELTGDAAPSSALEEDRAWVRAACAARFRETITRALAGEENADG